MATQKIYIVRDQTDTHDGLIKARDNGIIGRVWNKQGPSEKYISGTLEGHWIITDEEYKKLKNEKIHDQTKAPGQ